MDEVKRIIREARIDDAKNLLVYLQQVGGESEDLTFDAKGVPFTEKQEREYLDRRMCSYNNITLLALEGERIIGSLGVDTPSFERLSHRGEMESPCLKGAGAKGWVLPCLKPCSPGYMTVLLV